MFGVITQRQILDNYGVECDSLESTYIKYFKELGITPCIISNFQEAKLFNAEVLILTGGGSIPSKYYNAGHNDYIQDKRDALEKELFEQAIQNKIPILAICRGFQYVNALLGGKASKLTNLNSERSIKNDHEVQLKNKKIKVNNFHNDGIFEKDLAKELCIVAEDIENNIIEAFYSKELRLLGLQWHPEREFEDTDSKKVSTDLISKFIKNKGELDESHYFSRR